MNRLHGEIRAAVMSVLNKNFENHAPPKIPEETKIINELLREYLDWNGYLYTEQILSAGKLCLNFKTFYYYVILEKLTSLYI